MRIEYDIISGVTSSVSPGFNAKRGFLEDKIPSVAFTYVLSISAAHLSRVAVRATFGGAPFLPQLHPTATDQLQFS
jgi:hypothetical protein